MAEQQPTTPGQNESIQQDYVAYDQRQRQLMKALAGNAFTLSAFTSMQVAAAAEGELGTKVKELMAVAIAIQCEGCIVYHLRNALDAGASEKEVYEAVDVDEVGGAGTLKYAKRHRPPISCPSSRESRWQGRARNRWHRSFHAPSLTITPPTSCLYLISHPSA